MTQENSCIGIKTRFGPGPALKSVDVAGRLDGLLLEMRVRQSYCNESDDDIEVVYSFPLAWSARLLGLDVEIGGKKLRGAVVPREQARKKYEAAVENGDTPVMIEQSSDGIYTANLGNLRPGEEAVLDLRYAQLLRFEQGRVRLAVPTVIAPRYGNPRHAGALALHETAAASPAADYSLTLNIELHGDIAAAAQIISPSHTVTISDIPGGRSITIAPGATLARDFVLVIDGLAGKTFAIIASDNFGGKRSKTASTHTVLASFCPSIPRETKTPLLLKILIDCSGSMAGDSICSAREALHRVLAELDPGDHVSLSRFGGKVEHESRQLERCTPAAIRRLADAVSHTEANLGGTELRGALLSTFRDIAMPAATAGGSIPKPAVLLITDGEIWEMREAIAEAQRSDHRIFAVGVGSSPVETLHRELAAQTGGACELVLPTENTADAIVRMFHRLRTGTTMNVHVNWGTRAKPLWQSSLPRALYDGETVHLFAQFATPPPRPPQLRWKVGSAAHALCAQTLSTVPGDSLPRLAGAKKLDEAGTDAKRGKLALRYQLVSNQTNLFLVHIRAKSDKAGSLPSLHQVPQMLAAGWGGMGTVRKSEFMFSKGACEVISNTPAPVPDHSRQCHRSVVSVPKRRPSSRPIAFTMAEALEVTRITMRQMLVEKFSRFALQSTDFAAIVAQLSAVADADIAACIVDIARQTAASEEDVWAMLLDKLLKQDQARYTPPRQATRLLRARVKTIPSETQQAIVAARDFASLCTGA